MANAKGHGGKREGAGRPAGAVTKRSRAAADAAASAGLTPLAYMLGVLRDGAADPKDRMWAAEKAAPYVHAKLASVEMTGRDGGPVEVATITRRIVDPNGTDDTDA